MHAVSGATTVPIVSVLVISGSLPAVGETVVTAGIAALAARRGSRVAVLKPAQTGVTVNEPGDLATVRKLAGPVNTSELRRYPQPLSPEAAARGNSGHTVNPAEIAAAAAELHRDHDLVLVEGVGGLLVRFDPAGATLADVAWSLGAPVVIVADSGPGTLNVTALTAEVATGRGLDVAGVIIGRWPREPGLAARSHVLDLPVAAGAPLLGALRAGLGEATREEFLVEADTGLSPWFGGSFDSEEFAAAFATRA